MRAPLRRTSRRIGAMPPNQRLANAMSARFPASSSGASTGRSINSITPGSASHSPNRTPASAEDLRRIGVRCGNADRLEVRRKCDDRRRRTTRCSTRSRQLARAGTSVVLVHGGGPQIDAALRERGITEERIEGLRVTSAAAPRRGRGGALRQRQQGSRARAAGARRARFRVFRPGRRLARRAPDARCRAAIWVSSASRPGSTPGSCAASWALGVLPVIAPLGLDAERRCRVEPECRHRGRCDRGGAAGRRLRGAHQRRRASGATGTTRPRVIPRLTSPRPRASWPTGPSATGCGPRCGPRSRRSRGAPGGP